MINIIIVDDHKMVIDGIRLMLHSQPDIAVIATAYSGQEVLDKLTTIKPDVVLLDINMPGLNGIETCKKILAMHPEIKVIAISMHKESSLIKLMLRNGAKGYVLKNAGQDELVASIKTVYSGKMYLDQTVNQIVVNSITSKAKKQASYPFPSLSRREKQVLQLILEERTTQEIADALFISFGTVETHRRNMLIKTGARNTAGLVRICLEYDLHK